MVITRYQHADLRGRKRERLEIQTEVRLEGADESEIKKIKTGQTPVNGRLHKTDIVPQPEVMTSMSRRGEPAREYFP